FSARLKHRQELTEVLDKIFMRRTTQAWMDRFGSAVPASPILNLRDALDNPFLHENGNLVDCKQPNENYIRFLRNPIRFGQEIAIVPAPKLGEHTTEL